MNSPQLPREAAESHASKGGVPFRDLDLAGSTTTTRGRKQKGEFAMSSGEFARLTQMKQDGAVKLADQQSSRLSQPEGRGRNGAVNRSVVIESSRGGNTVTGPFSQLSNSAL